ncbi:hypothetical protein ACWEPL_64875, partial [Nonomuraea sp. NPDC004186]
GGPTSITSTAPPSESTTSYIATSNSVRGTRISTSFDVSDRGQERQPAREPKEDQIQEPQRHERR